MKYILIFCFSLFGFANVFSQAAIQTENDQVYQDVQTQPRFSGDINKYLSDNLNYPEEAKNNKQQGTVFVSFIVEKDGSVSSAIILQGVSPILDKEAIRFVSAMPKWIPGTQNGHAVRVRYNVPIRFVL